MINREERGIVLANLRILIADDSALYRRILSKAVESAAPGAEIELVKDGLEVLAKLRTSKYDAVLMDVNMPGKDGLETLSEIKPKYPNLPVIIISGVSSKSADLTLQALERGALDFIAKPQGGSFDENMENIIRPLRALFQQIGLRAIRLNIQQGRGGNGSAQAVRPMRSTPGTAASSQRVTPPGMASSARPSAATASSMPSSATRSAAESIIQARRSQTRIDTADLVLIASSTGGPAALERVICRLPATFNKPILVVQHMPAGFTKALADKMNNRSAVRVAEAADGTPIRPGLVLIAPGGSHMVVSRGKLIRLNGGDYVNGVRPAADVLFRSVAKEFSGSKILSVVLTGMGSDGMAGVRELKQACRCYSLTQSETSCVVYGMPKAVVDAGLSDEVAELDKVAARIDEIVRRGSGG